MTLTYGQYRALLETNRRQEDRAAAYRAFHQAYADSQNTYAALYNGVLQRDWFHARARGYASTLDAALHGNNIPTSVVENLIAVTKQGVEPLRRYHRLRRRVLGLERYSLFDIFVPLVEHDAKYPYDEVGHVDCRFGRAAWAASIRPRVHEAFDGRWIDVFENAGKRSGAYSAPVYGAHPYMLLNYNETLDAVFTLAHEMGHSMHTLPVARGAAVRLRRLHDLRRRSAVDAERGAVPRSHAGARRTAATSARCCCSTRSTASPARSTRR